MEMDPVRIREQAKVLAKTLKPLRTNRTLRMMAKEFAAAWWDESCKLGDGEYATREEKEFAKHRSAMFRAAWPDQKVYVTLCWPHFYKQARSQAVAMLGPTSGVSEHMKARIYDDVLDDFEKQSGAPKRRFR